MSRTKKILFCIISVFLVFALLCSFRFKADEFEPTQHWDAQQIKELSTTVGYNVSTDDETGSEVYSSFVGISHILLPHDGSDFDIVVVKLAAPIAPVNVKNDVDSDEDDDLEEISIPEPRLYYNIDEYGHFVNGNYCDSVPINNGSTIDAETTLVFKTAFPKEKNVIALNIDGEFSVEYVTVYEVTGKTATLHFNFIAFIAFVAVLLLTLIFEKKLRYFSFLYNKCVSEITRLKELYGKEKRHFWIRISALCFTAIFVLFTCILIMFDRFTKLTLTAVFVLCILALTFQLIYRIKYASNSNAGRLFLTVALLIGLMFCYTSPITTWSSWDDEAHFSNSYTVATLGQDEQTLAEVKLFSYCYTLKDYISNPNHFVRIMTEEAEICAEYEHSFGNFYTQISYLPMTLTIALAKALTVDMAKTIVLCRLANMLAFIFISYMGIRKLKSGAYIFSAVCLLPCILYLSCSIGYDAWLIAWLVYCFAYIISLIQQPDRKITPLDCAKILLAFFIGCSAKALYCVLMLPLMFISKDKFAKPSHAKVFRILTVLTVLVIIAILVLPGIFSFNFYADSRGGTDIDPLRQFVYVITHPFEFARTLFVHMEDLCSPKRFNVYSATFGYLDGYEGSNQLLYGTVAMFILIFCIFADRRDGDNYECALMQKTRWITLATCFLTVVVICGSMYAAFNDVGATTIKGTQFRYLFPMFAPFFYFLKPKKLYWDISESKKSALIFGGLSANILLGYFTTYLWKFWI